MKPSKIVEPVIKWSGSKRQVAPTLSQFITKGNTYFEPFVGGGAMLPFRNIQKGVANDIIPELIDLWTAIKENPEETALEYQIRWERLQNEGINVYYDIRENFNKTKNCFDFLFLTRTCVNGLIRYNEKGEFNNSFHLTRKGIQPKTLREIILKWSSYIQEISFYNADYRDVLKEVKKGDFVFLDPPYIGTKGRYTKNNFDFDSFYNSLEYLNSIEANWLLTFDGNAGKRAYSCNLPEELYKQKLLIKTGHSPFTKTMKTTLDEVFESVYLNFEPNPKLLLNFTQQVNQKPTLFDSFAM